ncbi:MAG: Exosome complex RNA-binding protein Csl4 [Methanophagales archaeon]|nr:Exosome complex RNA-binding protein Csl4 [Methanophagales archaeon]
MKRERGIRKWERREKQVKGMAVENKKIVVPGDFLGTTEEFTLGAGVYDEKGNIYAALTGEVRVSRRREIEVVPVVETPPLPREGDIVIGRVEDLKDSLVVVSIACLWGREDRSVAVSLPGVIHISNIKRGFVKDLRHEFGILDLVKARVIDAKALRLSTAEPELGVIKACCSACRGDMLRRGNVLVCENCNRIELRKIASDYMRVA